MSISRKEFLMSVGGMAVGVPLGVAGQQWRTQEPIPKPNPEPSLPADAVADAGCRSFAQCGEDVATNIILEQLRQTEITYLDIGAYHPIVINNTYFFYRKGHRGVLVEPNVTMCEQLRAMRPRDTTLAAGIGITSVREADYYVMTDPSWNTFSKEEAEHQIQATNGRVRIQQVIKMPLLDINDVLAQYFPKPPSFLSIDAEGLHLAILKAIDYSRFRPVVICVETLESGTNKTMPDAAEFMMTKGYVQRGGSFVNALFVDGHLL